jgi:hypothetical protein
MFTATFFFFALAVCLVAGLVLFSLVQSCKPAVDVDSPNGGTSAWSRCKSALAHLHSTKTADNAPTHKALRSWAGTLLICSGLCMIGVVLEAEYGGRISSNSVFAGLLGEPTVSGATATGHQHKGAASTKGAKNTKTNKNAATAKLNNT